MILFGGKIFYNYFCTLFFQENSYEQENTFYKSALDDCITYALTNNIQLKRSHITQLSAQEDLLQSKAALLPSLSASTSQNVVYRPFIDSNMGAVTNGTVEYSVDKFYYNGTYGVSGSWTVWDGMRRKNTIKLNEMNTHIAKLDSAAMALSIQEQKSAARRWSRWAP